MRWLNSLLLVGAIGCGEAHDCGLLPTILDGLLCYDAQEFTIDHAELERRAQETKCVWLTRLPKRKDFSPEVPGRIYFGTKDAMYQAGYAGIAYADCLAIGLIGDAVTPAELAIEHELIHFFDCRTNPSGDWYFTTPNFNHEAPYYGEDSIDYWATKGGNCEHVD